MVKIKDFTLALQNLGARAPLPPCPTHLPPISPHGNPSALDLFHLPVIGVRGVSVIIGVRVIEVILEIPKCEYSYVELNY